MSAALADRVAARDWYPHARACPGRGHAGLVRPPGHARQGRRCPPRWPGSAVSTSGRSTASGPSRWSGAGRPRSWPPTCPTRPSWDWPVDAPPARDRRAARAPRGRRRASRSRARRWAHGWSGSRAASTTLDPEVDGRVRPRLRRLAAAAPARPRRRTGARARRVPRAGAGRGRHRPAVVARPAAPPERHRRRPRAAVVVAAQPGRARAHGRGGGVRRSRRGRARCSCRPVPGSRRRRAGPRSPTCARAGRELLFSGHVGAPHAAIHARCPGIRKFRRDPASRIAHRTCGCLYGEATSRTSSGRAARSSRGRWRHARGQAERRHRPGHHRVAATKARRRGRRSP